MLRLLKAYDIKLFSNLYLSRYRMSIPSIRYVFSIFLQAVFVFHKMTDMETDMHRINMIVPACLIASSIDQAGAELLFHEREEGILL